MMEPLTTRPCVSEETVRVTLQRLYGIDSLDIVRIKELDGYDDRNLRVEVKSDPNGFVLKITNSLDSERTDLVDGQHALMEHLSSKKFSVPLPVRNKHGEYYSVEKFGKNQTKHVVRLLKYVVGIRMVEAMPCDDLFENVGQFTASLTEALQDFHNDALANRTFPWCLVESPKILQYVDSVVETTERRELVKLNMKLFEEKVLTQIDSSQRGIIHGDMNEQNLLVAHSSSTKIDSLLDFGDAHEAPVLFEAALALTYSMIHAGSVNPARPFLVGYERVRPLMDSERCLLKICVGARLCQSLVLGLVSAKKDPENEYILITQKAGWKVLEELSSCDGFS